MARLTDLDAVEQDVRERASIQEGRPEGCTCLGVGGLGVLIAVLSDGLPLFGSYCSCREGEELREAAAWANEAVSDEDERQRRDTAAQQARARSLEILARAGIERRYERCTFENFRTLLAVRGLTTEAVLKYIGLLENSYAHNEPVRGDYICGDPGHGKTSLGLSALRAWIGRGRVGRFISEGEFLDRIRASMDAHDGEGGALLEYLKTVPLLVFDDLAMTGRTPYERGKVVSLIVSRHAANLLTVFTSNYDLRTAALRLSGDDRLEYNRLEGRLREMCDECHLVTGQLRTPRREDAPV